MDGEDKTDDPFDVYQYDDTPDEVLTSWVTETRTHIQFIEGYVEMLQTHGDTMDSAQKERFFRSIKYRIQQLTDEVSAARKRGTELNQMNNNEHS